MPASNMTQRGGREREGIKRDEGEALMAKARHWQRGIERDMAKHRESRGTQQRRSIGGEG